MDKEYIKTVLFGIISRQLKIDSSHLELNYTMESNYTEMKLLYKGHELVEFSWTKENEETNEICCYLSTLSMLLGNKMNTKMVLDNIDATYEEN